MAVTEMCKDGRLYQRAGAWRERGRLGYHVSDLYKSVYEQQFFLFFKGYFTSALIFYALVLTDLLRFACCQNLLCQDCQEAYKQGKGLETVHPEEEDSATDPTGGSRRAFNPTVSVATSEIALAGVSVNFAFFPGPPLWIVSWSLRDGPEREGYGA